jgi:hypothetical protein
MAMDRTVTVWGKPQLVQVTQLSRTSFNAGGSYDGHTIYASGPSAAAALAAWAAKAKSKGQKRA